jgi:hypothetical protein
MSRANLPIRGEREVAMKYAGLFRSLVVVIVFGAVATACDAPSSCAFNTGFSMGQMLGSHGRVTPANYSCG